MSAPPNTEAVLHLSLLPRNQLRVFDRREVYTLLLRSSNYDPDKKLRQIQSLTERDHPAIRIDVRGVVGNAEIAHPGQGVRFRVAVVDFRI